MILNWFRDHRRQKLLAQPFPSEWEACLTANFWHDAWLSTDERHKLRDDLRVLVAEKNWEGCGGLAMTAEIKVTIAANAALLVLPQEHDFYSRIKSILVYPTQYSVSRAHPQPGGIVDETPRTLLGEASYTGAVVLAWDDVLASSRGHSPGHNVVLHEFAHVLDMQDRVVDGTPPLRDGVEYRYWKEVMSVEYRRLVQSSERGSPTLLDQYGATNEGEFFAVATECFFESSVPLRERHPELYEVLQSFYGQDPATRLSQTPGP